MAKQLQNVRQDLTLKTTPDSRIPHVIAWASVGDSPVIPRRNASRSSCNVSVIVFSLLPKLECADKF